MDQYRAEYLYRAAYLRTRQNLTKGLLGRSILWSVKDSWLSAKLDGNKYGNQGLV